MKKKLFTILTILLSQWASSQDTPEAFARQVADRIKDSVGLSTTQAESIYQVNLDLSTRKQQQWKLYASRDSIRVKVQAIENGRDSLYKGVMTPAQFQLYLERKSRLIGRF